MIKREAVTLVTFCPQQPVRIVLQRIYMEDKTNNTILIHNINTRVMAKFIIIRGTKDSGKTTTAGLVYIELLKIAETKHSFNGKDVETNSLEYNKEMEIDRF